MFWNVPILSNLFRSASISRGNKKGAAGCLKATAAPFFKDTAERSVSLFKKTPASHIRPLLR